MRACIQVHAGLKMQIETNERKTLDLETERQTLQVRYTHGRQRAHLKRTSPPESPLPPFRNTHELTHGPCICPQDEHAKLDTAVSGRGRWNDIDQKRTVLTAKLKLLKEKEGKLLLKRMDQATYSQGIFALVSVSRLSWPGLLACLGSWRASGRAKSAVRFSSGTPCSRV